MRGVSRGAISTPGRGASAFADKIGTLGVFMRRGEKEKDPPRAIKEKWLGALTDRQIG